MPSLLDTYVTLQSRMADNWTLSAVEYDNVPFTPPRSAAGVPQPYVSFSILEGEGTRIDVADSPRYRWVGVIRIILHLPVDTTEKLLTTYFDSVYTIWNDKQWLYNDELIKTRTPYVFTREEILGYYQVHVVVPYQRDPVA